MQEKKKNVEEALGIKGWEISPPPLGEGKTLKKKISSCLPQQKKKRHTRKRMHSPPTKTNSWRCRQTRRKLISSPTRRGLQGEKGGREGGSRGRSGGIVFYSSLSLSLSFSNPCVARRPAGPSSLSLSLAPLSLPKACFSLSPAPPLHQSPSASPPPSSLPLL